MNSFGIGIEKIDGFRQYTTNWKFQLDNQLPVSLYESKLFISKGTYHRLIKGTGDLVIKIWQKY